MEARPEKACLHPFFKSDAAKRRCEEELVYFVTSLEHLPTIAGRLWMPMNISSEERCDGVKVWLHDPDCWPVVTVSCGALGNISVSDGAIYDT